MTDIQNSKAKCFCSKKYMTLILHPRAYIILPILILVILFFFQVLKTAMTFLMPDNWQISGYYLSGLQNGLILLIAVSWLISVAILFLNRQFTQGILRILLVLVFFFVFGFSTAIFHLMLFSRICGWPSDTVYSKEQQKYYIIARGPLPIDVYYHVYSTTGTLLNPKWTFEFATGSLGFSNAITEKPHLILSGDEELLVMGRGKYLTDAFLFDSKVSLVNGIRDPQLRNSQIESLLQKHSSKNISEEIQNPFTYPLIRTILNEYYQKMGKELTEHFSNDGWTVVCELSEVSWDGVKVHSYYTVECSRENTRRTFSRDMKLVDDKGQLIIIEQDSGLTWSDDEEKILCEKVRDAISNIAGEGIYIN